MTIDLSKLRKGDTVVFRCGGKAVVESVAPVVESVSANIVRFVGYTSEGIFSSLGICVFGNTHPFDIIAIEPAKRESAVDDWLIVHTLEKRPAKFREWSTNEFKHLANAIKQDILDEIKNGGG